MTTPPPQHIKIAATAAEITAVAAMGAAEAQYVPFLFFSIFYLLTFYLCL